jgi:hypothetical protein
MHVVQLLDEFRQLPDLHDSSKSICNPWRRLAETPARDPQQGLTHTFRSAFRRCRSAKCPIRR